MKFLLKLIFVLLSIAGILLIVAFFVDGKFSISRSIEIERSKTDVLEYVLFLENQQDYSVWYTMDPAIKITQSGEDGTVGFITRWSSNNDEVGKGEQEITQIIDGVGFDSELRFKEPMELTAQATVRTKTISPTQSAVTWTMSGETPYPFNLLSLFIDMDEELGPDLEKGLKNLKKILESENN
jgi:hypothetical protein